MKLVVMCVVFKVVDCVLPVGRQDVAVVAMQALTDLFIISVCSFRQPMNSGALYSRLPMFLDTILVLAQSLAPKAVETVSNATAIRWSATGFWQRTSPWWYSLQHSRLWGEGRSAKMYVASDGVFMTKRMG